jgi:hypothetical protein
LTFPAELAAGQALVSAAADTACDKKDAARRVMKINPEYQPSSWDQ